MIFSGTGSYYVLTPQENPKRANGHIFNVGNPHNEVTVRELAELMTDVYCKVSGQPRPAVATIDVTSQEFYGVGYDDSDKRIPDMTIIKRQLGMLPLYLSPSVFLKLSLNNLLYLPFSHSNKRILSVNICAVYSSFFKSVSELCNLSSVLSKQFSKQLMMLFNPAEVLRSFQ